RVVGRCGALRVRTGRAHAGSRSTEVRRERFERPLVAPLVIVRRRSPDHHARVVCRTAAHDPCAERSVVLAAHAPVVTESERTWVENVGGPPALGPWAVVWPGL